MKIKPKFLRYGSFHLNNGRQIRFWEDKWLGSYNFQQQYSSLYNIVRRKSDTIANVLSAIPLNVSFRRYLEGNNLTLWNDLVLRVAQIQLRDQNDVFKWNLHQSDQFSVHSLYLALISNRVVQHNTKSLEDENTIKN
jgi:hypothetical protein